MTGLPQTRCYAVRRLNPFLGVTQVIETASGRASSTNGVVWDIQILVPRARTWGSLGAHSSGKAWYRYGLWSERDGLVHRPLAAQATADQMVHDSETLVQQLCIHLDQLPFTLRDRRELWLLDANEKKPLVLLYAMPPDIQPPRPEPRHWSGCLGQQGLAGQKRFPEIVPLESQVRKRAGFNIQRLWITWNEERTAITDGYDRIAPNTVFPGFGIREDWPDAIEEERVQRYIDWTAPALLTLPYLDGAQRAYLESRLSGQAVSVEYHWRLYPEVLDRNKLLSARVQADLQRSE